MEWRVENLIDGCRAQAMAQRNVSQCTEEKNTKGKIIKQTGVKTQKIQRLEVVISQVVATTTTTTTTVETAAVAAAMQAAAAVATTKDAVEPTALAAIVQKMIDSLKELKLTDHTVTTNSTTTTAAQQMKQKSKAQETLPTIPGIERIAEDPNYCAALEVVLLAWENRSASWKRATIPSTQAVQARFLWLIPLPPATAILEFDTLVSEKDWCYATASQYFSAFKTARATLGHPMEPEFKLHSKILGFLAREEGGKRPTVPMSEAFALALVNDLAASVENEPAAEIALAMAEAVEMAFTLGQRMGDVLKLESVGISTILDQIEFTPNRNQEFWPPRAPNTRYLTITFRKGKTVRRRQPYTLHLPYSSALAQKTPCSFREEPEIGSTGTLAFLPLRLHDPHQEVHSSSYTTGMGTSRMQTLDFVDSSGRSATHGLARSFAQHPPTSLATCRLDDVRPLHGLGEDKLDCCAGAVCTGGTSDVTVGVPESLVRKKYSQGLVGEKHLQPFSDDLASKEDSQGLAKGSIHPQLSPGLAKGTKHPQLTPGLAKGNKNPQLTSETLSSGLAKGSIHPQLTSETVSKKDSQKGTNTTTSISREQYEHLVDKKSHQELDEKKNLQHDVPP